VAIPTVATAVPFPFLLSSSIQLELASLALLSSLALSSWLELLRKAGEGFPLDFTSLSLAHRHFEFVNAHHDPFPARMDPLALQFELDVRLTHQSRPSWGPHEDPTRVKKATKSDSEPIFIPCLSLMDIKLLSVSIERAR